MNNCLAFLILFFSLFLNADTFAKESYYAWKSHFEDCVRIDECPVDCLRASFTEMSCWLQKVTTEKPVSVSSDHIKAAIFKTYQQLMSFEIWRFCLEN